jgi:hypothetical protein
VRKPFEPSQLAQLIARARGRAATKVRA